MTGIGILLSPPVAFFVFLAAAFGLYGLGKGMAPKLTKVGGKLDDLRLRRGHPRASRSSSATGCSSSSPCSSP